MSKATIKQSLVSLDPVMVSEGWITDRFILWRPESAPAKLLETVRYLPDGAYKLSAAGAATRDESITVPSMSSLDRIADVEPGEELTMTGLTHDRDVHQKIKGRIFHGGGAVVMVDDRLTPLWGHYRLHLAGTYSLGQYGKLAIVRGDDLVGVVMSVRMVGAVDEIVELAGLLGKPAAEIAA